MWLKEVLNLSAQKTNKSGEEGVAYTSHEVYRIFSFSSRPISCIF